MRVARGVPAHAERFEPVVCAVEEGDGGGAGDDDAALPGVDGVVLGVWMQGGIDFEEDGESGRVLVCGGDGRAGGGDFGNGVSEVGSGVLLGRVGVVGKKDGAVAEAVGR